MENPIESKPELTPEEGDQLIEQNLSRIVQEARAEIAASIQDDLRQAYQAEVKDARGELEKQAFLRIKYKTLGMGQPVDFDRPEIKTLLGDRVAQKIPTLKKHVLENADQVLTSKQQNALQTQYNTEMKSLRGLNPTERGIRYAKLNDKFRKAGLKGV